MYFRGEVIAVNSDTGEVFSFESQREAARRLGVDAGHLNDVVKGRLNKTKGWWFCYANENAIEKTRKKFDDETAYKVEELINQK